MAANPCVAVGGRLQKSRSSRWGQARQFSMISRPYGARIRAPPRSIPPSLRDTKRNPLGIRDSFLRTHDVFFLLDRWFLGCDGYHATSLCRSLQPFACSVFLLTQFQLTNT